jgi:hypothetical protein
MDRQQASAKKGWIGGVAQRLERFLIGRDVIGGTACATLGNSEITMHSFNPASYAATALPRAR